jgi:hypothetical protein
MHKITIPFLIVIADMLDKIKEMMPKLADHLNVSIQELPYLDHKILENDGEHFGIYDIVKNTNWKFGYRGYQCWFVHTKDKRELIVTFGPEGRIDTFSEWRVIEYIGQSKSPWLEYKKLKKFPFLRDNEYEKIPNWEERNILIRDELEINKFDQVKKDCHLCEKTSLLMDELEANELIVHPYLSYASLSKNAGLQLMMAPGCFDFPILSQIKIIEIL